MKSRTTILLLDKDFRARNIIFHNKEKFRDKTESIKRHNYLKYIHVPNNKTSKFR